MAVWMDLAIVFAVNRVGSLKLSIFKFKAVFFKLDWLKANEKHLKGFLRQIFEFNCECDPKSAQRVKELKEPETLYNI